MSETTGRHRRDETAAAEPAAAPSAWQTWMAVGCAALCVPAVVVGVLLGLHVRHQDRLDSARSAALRAASTAAQAILSYDYRTIAKDIASAEKVSTGEFRTNYASLARTLTTDAQQARAIVQAVVVQDSTGVISVKENRVVVLLFVNQFTVKQASGQASPQSRFDLSRVEMTLSDVNGKWLVSNLAAV